MLMEWLKIKGVGNKVKYNKRKKKKMWKGEMRNGVKCLHQQFVT